MVILPHIDRRKLLTSAAAITVARPPLTIPHTKALTKSEIGRSTKASLVLSAEASQNLATVTVLRLREIADRNVIRQEAALPLLSVPKELRLMKEAADTEKFRKFADAHRKRMYEKMLARVRRQCGDPAWAPTGVLSGGGLWFNAQVDARMRKLYRRVIRSLSGGSG